MKRTVKKSFLVWDSKGLGKRMHTSYDILTELNRLFLHLVGDSKIALGSHQEHCTFSYSIRNIVVVISPRIFLVKMKNKKEI